MKLTTVGAKITLTCGVLVSLTVLMGICSFLGLRSVNAVTQEIISDPLPSNYYGGRLNAGAKKMVIWMGLHIQSQSKDEMQQLESRIAARLEQWQGERREYEKMVTDDNDRAIVTKLDAAAARLFDAWEKILPLSRAMQNQQAQALYHDTAMPALEELDKALNELVNGNRANGERLGRDAARSAATARAWVIVLLVLSAISGAAFAFFIVRSVNRALRRAATELSEGADQVAAAAGQVSSSSQSLAQGTSEQAASIEETSASTEEINSMARRNSDNSRSAAGLVTQSQQKFNETNHSLENMVTAMGEITSSSDKISKIIKVIDEIAFQTNILALNAAVEAARAGEAGMGFAVVADEVRNLAQRCSQAAGDTAALIEDSISKSNAGKVKVDEVAEAIRAITQQSGQIKTLVDEVNLGSEEQSRGIEQIAKAIAQMEQVTQKNAANAEESASAAEELTAQSETLRDVVYQLNSIVGGAQAEAPVRARRAHKKPAAAQTPAAEPVAAHTKSKHSAIPLDSDFKNF